MIIGRIFYFSSSHFLPTHPGKCKSLHGHNYKLEIEIEGRLNENEMVADFKDLDQIVNGCVIDVFDHKHLNDFFSNPTAEVITKDIKERLTSVLPAGIKVHRIKLWENHKSYAIYRRNS